MKQKLITTSLLLLPIFTLSNIACSEDVLSESEQLQNIQPIPTVQKESTMQPELISAKNTDITTSQNAVVSKTPTLSTTTDPVSTEVTPVQQNVVAVSPLVTEAPKLSRQDNAILHLSIIRDEVNTVKKGGFLGGLFSSNTAIQETLLQDIDLFLTIYHDLDIAAEAFLLRGQLLLKQGHEEAAAVTWLQTLYEFPTSGAATNAKDQLNILITSDWKDHAEQISSIMNKVSHEDLPTRLSKLINQLYPVDNKEVTQASIALQLNFLKRFPTNTHADEVQTLLAHNYGSESAESGVFGFKKLLALYPYSSYRPEAMLAIADLQRLRLKAYEKAVHNYAILIQEHPNHRLSKNAHEHLALTYENHLKNYSKALDAFEDIVAKYAKDKLALLALHHIANIQEKKTKQPRKAVATLRKLATMFHGNEGVTALELAIKIADKKVKDAGLVVETQQQLITDYPDSEAAPKAMFKMAEIAEKLGQGKGLYQKFINTYPNHRLVRKAQKRLSS